MKVLIVGAGAIGASYGWMLKRAGAEISYLIKPKHRANLENGLHIYEYQRRGKPVLHHHLSDFGILDDVALIGKVEFDFVLLTVASPALSDEVWLKSLISNLHPKSTLVTLQPGHHDHEKILNAGMDPKKLVWGTIPILAYLAPMPGEKLPEPGIAF
jgi:2-dehydropantoate 2-reductase